MPFEYLYDSGLTLSEFLSSRSRAVDQPYVAGPFVYECRDDGTRRAPRANDDDGTGIGAPIRIDIP